MDYEPFTLQCLSYGADAFFPLQRFANASLRIRAKVCAECPLSLSLHLSMAAKGKRNNSNLMHIANILVSASAGKY